MPFYRNSSVLVLVILVDVYPVTQGIHGDAGGMAKLIAILQSAHDDAGLSGHPHLPAIPEADYIVLFA